MAAEPLTPQGFAERCGVSRETLDRLELYCALLRRWQRAVNLVSRASLGDVWRRHIWDSAQLLPHLPARPGRLLDVGSGAGFPGLVLAMMGVEGITLVESDTRKCAFLREAARQTDTRVTIHAARLAQLEGRIAPPAIITARAVAPLPLLLDMIKLYITPNTICLFHKGRRAETELAEARKHWSLRVQRIQSETEPSGVILRLEDVIGGREHATL